MDENILRIPSVRIEKKEGETYFGKSKFVKELTPKDFDKKGVLKNKKCHFIMFYKLDCPYCKYLKEEWIKLSEFAEFCTLAAFNVNSHSDSEAYKNVDPMIDSYPSCIIYKDGKPSEIYSEKENRAIFILPWLMEKF